MQLIFSGLSRGIPDGGDRGLLRASPSPVSTLTVAHVSSRGCEPRPADRGLRESSPLSRANTHICGGGRLSLICSRLRLIIHINHDVMVHLSHRIRCSVAEDEDPDAAFQRPLRRVKFTCSFPFRRGWGVKKKGQTLSLQTFRSANRSLINIHARKSIQMVALTVGSMCKR